MENIIKKFENKIFENKNKLLLPFVSKIKTKEDIPDHIRTEISYWNNILFSLKIIDFSINNFLKEEDLVIASGFGKLVIMELWNIRKFLMDLKQLPDNFDIEIPKLEELRNSYAHISERVAGFKNPYNSPKEKLAWGKIPNDMFSSGRVFNLEICNTYGIMGIFAISGDSLVCNTESDVIEFKINENLKLKITSIVEKVLLNFSDKK